MRRRPWQRSRERVHQLRCGGHRCRRCRESATTHSAGARRSPTVRSIKMFAFLGGASLRAAELPDSAAEIGSSAVEKCRSLKQTRIPPLVAEVGAYTLLRVSGVCRTQRVANGHQKVGVQRLRQTAAPPSVSLIGNSAFRNCKSLCRVALPAAMAAVSNCHFKDCARLIKVEIPPVTRTGHCTSLCEVEIPPAVSKIANNAFEGCAINKSESEVPPNSVPSDLLSDERDCAINKSESEVHDRVYS